VARDAELTRAAFPGPMRLRAHERLDPLRSLYARLRTARCARSGYTESVRVPRDGFYGLATSAPDRELLDPEPERHAERT
jgi:hypothetical protein